LVVTLNLTQASLLLFKSRQGLLKRGYNFLGPRLHHDQYLLLLPVITRLVPFFVQCPVFCFYFSSYIFGIFSAEAFCLSLRLFKTSGDGLSDLFLSLLLRAVPCALDGFYQNPHKCGFRSFTSYLFAPPPIPPFLH